MSLPAARRLYEQVTHAVLLYDLSSGRALYANPIWGQRVGFLEPGKLDQVANFIGRNEIQIRGFRVALQVSELPLEGHPQARLIQEAEAISSSAVVDPTFRTTFPLGVAWIDNMSNRVVQLTDAFIKIWGLPPARTSERADRLRAACAGLVLNPAAVETAWPRQAAGTGRFVDVALTDGRSLRISTVDATFGHRWIVVEDVTEPKQQREARYQREIRSREMQQLESLCVLAGGMAHDFNKLILAIFTNAEVLREEVRLDAAGRLATDRIRSAAEQASKLSAQMLAFSGRGHMITQRTDLEPVLRAMADGQATILTAPSPSSTEGHPTVMGDPDQLTQLFSALVRNASESGASNVSIDWSIHSWTTDALSDLYLGDRLVGGAYVVVTVKDDGEGIDKANLSRVFEPFFSTRGAGRGLGLAVAAGIARGHGGTIDIDSRPEQGAAVRVLLPAAPPLRRVPSSPSSRRRSTPVGAVLLVDGEALVRRSARYALEQAGFAVTEAENGDQALSLFTAQPQGFDLIIMDIATPGVSGELAAARMKSLMERPVPVVLSSGYGATPKPGAENIADRLLHRPYRRAELVQTARLLLEKHAERDGS
ncbi:MAG: ATP-binding protein [Myxococcota bacterium]